MSTVVFVDMCSDSLEEFIKLVFIVCNMLRFIFCLKWDFYVD